MMRGLAMLIALAGADVAAGAQRPPTARDGADYAVASCLAAQPNAFLRDQGFGLGAIVTNRAGLSPSRWATIADAVKAELAHRPMLTIHGDGPVGQDKPMPVAHCIAVADAPRVRAAIARAIGR